MTDPPFPEKGYTPVFRTQEVWRGRFYLPKVTADVTFDNRILSMMALKVTTKPAMGRKTTNRAPRQGAMTQARTR